MVVDGTPLITYPAGNLEVIVKREDLCCPYPGPSFSKMRGVAAHIANRPEGYKPKNARPFKCIVPLPEIISEIENVGVASKRVQTKFLNTLEALGNEFSILLDLPIKDIEAYGGKMLAEAIKRMRDGKINIAAGYDGEYGKINIFDDKDRESLSSQESLF